MYAVHVAVTRVHSHTILYITSTCASTVRTGYMSFLSVHIRVHVRHTPGALCRAGPMWREIYVRVCIHVRVQISFNVYITLPDQIE